MTELVVCDGCRKGGHPHDRYVADGTDAGCPYLVDVGGRRVPCQCPAVVHEANLAPRRHCPTCSCGPPRSSSTVRPIRPTSDR